MGAGEVRYGRERVLISTAIFRRLLYRLMCTSLELKNLRTIYHGPALSYDLSPGLGA
jgi:hypothetical protein